MINDFLNSIKIKNNWPYFVIICAAIIVTMSGFGLKMPDFVAISALSALVVTCVFLLIVSNDNIRLLSQQTKSDNEELINEHLKPLGQQVASISTATKSDNEKLINEHLKPLGQQVASISTATKSDNEELINGHLTPLGQQVASISTAINEVLVGTPLKSFNIYRTELGESIKNADSIWLLLHTGNRFWYSYRGDIIYILNKSTGNDKIRILTWDPRPPHLTCSMAKNAMRNDKDAVSIDAVANVKQFLTIVSRKDKINSKVIDYLSGWTLFFINPDEREGKESMIFVELVEYLAFQGKKERPAFKLTPQDTKWFNRFKDGFDTMFKCSQDWKKHTVFEITEESLVKMKGEAGQGIDVIIQKLESLKNQKIIGLKEFKQKLTLTLKEEQKNRYESIIIKHAEWGNADHL